MYTVRLVKRDGFSLVELVVATGIVALLTLMGVSSFHNSTARGSCEGLALQVAEELRAAAANAIANRTTTAVVFPTAGGNQPITSFYYVLTGDDSPQVTRRQEISKSFPGMSLFIGQWNPTSGAFTTTAPVIPGNKWQNFAVSTWVQTNSALTSRTTDDFFVFQPDGTVVTNQQHYLDADKSYHVVVAAGAHYSGTSLTSAGQCWTVSITPLGAVTATAGLPYSSGIAAAGQVTNQASPETASAPALSPPPTGNPTAAASSPSVLPLPDTHPNTPSPGQGTLALGQVATLYMAATSPGKPLFVNWTVSHVTDANNNDVTASRGKGTYSFPATGGRMEWDPSLQAYTSYWQWAPPPVGDPIGQAEPGDTFTIGCEVSNDPSGSVPAAIGAKKIIINPVGTVLFESNRTDIPSLGSATVGVFSMDLNGQNIFCNWPGFSQPSATPDGGRIVFIKGGDIYMTSPFSPVPPVQLTHTGNCAVPAISSNGNEIAYMDSTLSNIYVMPAKTVGSATTLVTGLSAPSEGAARTKLTWNQAGTTLYYANPGAGIYSVGVTGSPAAASCGTGSLLLLGPTCTFPPSVPTLFYENGAPATDPFLWQSAAAGGAATQTHWSDLQDEALPERDPSGTTTILESYSYPANEPDQFQIIQCATSAGIGSVGVYPSLAYPPNLPSVSLMPPGSKPITNSQTGYCTRAVWCLPH